MPDAGLLEVEVVRGQAGARQWQCWHTRGDKLCGPCRQLTRGHHYTPPHALQHFHRYKQKIYYLDILKYLSSSVVL